MKTKLSLVSAFLICCICFSQSGINYKAIIKDGTGTIVSNQAVTIRFAIKQTSSAGSTVYEETHTTSTNASGLVLVNIGEGTPVTGTFSTINWGDDSHFLNVRVNTGSGFMNMGTSEFKTVPYALDAANVSGLEQVTEIDDEDILNTGWRLVGRDPEKYGPIGENAVDLSNSGSTSEIRGATGFNSTTMGVSTIASGNYSTAMGASTRASEYASLAMGSSTKASGFASTAMGNSTEASGISSTSMGEWTLARSSYSTALGRYNVGNGAQGWVSDDPLFEIGNGSSPSNRSNAMTVLKDGKVGIGEAQPNSALEILYNSGTNSSHAHLKETSGGFSRLSFSNANRPSDFWTISALVGTSVANDRLNFFNSDAGDIMSIHGNNQVHIAGSVYVNGGLVHASDRRLKKDIEPLHYGLKEVLQLQPKMYNWKHKETEHKSLGLIAQELELVLKELVIKDSDTKMLSVNYTELIPILIKAVQEQQEIVDEQNSRLKTQNLKIDDLTAELEQKDNKSREFDHRLKQIETQLKTSN